MTQLPPPHQPRELPAIHPRLPAQADNAYPAYLNICRMNACLGWEIKVQRGFFGQAEISAHKAAAEMLGKHRALQEVANILRTLIQEGK